MFAQEENALMRQFSMRIFKDVQKYLAEHQEEYQSWLEEQKRIDQKIIIEKG